jgi:hypothetical protein
LIHQQSILIVQAIARVITACNSYPQDVSFAKDETRWPTVESNKVAENKDERI